MKRSDRSGKPISIAEPVTDLRHVPIEENGEPLVDFSAYPEVRIAPKRYDYRRETLLRASVLDRLLDAISLLREGYEIAIIEGWRPPLIQARMYRTAWNRIQAANPDWSEAHVRRVANRFTAPIDSRVPPPHTTGAAMDVELLGSDGKPCDMWTPYARRDIRGFPTGAPGLSDHAKENRLILTTALARAGITNYPSEYWHFSFGDQGWAYRGGHPAAVYGGITPDGWSAAPCDVSDEPLTYVYAPNP